MLPAIRVAIGVASIGGFAIGLILVMAGQAEMVGGGLWLIVLGAVGLIGLTFERFRYQSEAAEQSGQSPGAAGADTGDLDPRFRPTDERFVDPSTRQALRVWVDPASGERRYRLDE